MPTYEYECTNDGSRFDLWQNVGAPPPACPQCGAATKKVFGVPRVIFKGSGFYLTDKRAEADAKSGAKAKSESGDGKSESKSESSETKSDSKTEAKSESKPDAATPTPSSSSGDKK